MNLRTKIGENYRAWQVDIQDFYKCSSDKERLEFLLRFAVLAPSSHNSQPWRFEVSDSQIKIYADMARSLPASDKNDRQLHISLGCAIENILTAAEYYGYVVQVKLFPETADDTYIANIVFTELASYVRPSHHNIFTIPKRHANRTKYDNRLPEEDFIARVKSFASATTQIHFITDKAKKDAIAGVVIEAGIAAMRDSGFRRELSRYIKNNYTSSPVGMPLYGCGVPGPISLIAPFMMKHINMNKVNAKTDVDILKNHTPAVLIIATRDDTKKEWLEAGILYERIALEAEHRGMSTAPSAAAIQIGEFYKKLQEILQTTYRPQFFARLGYAKGTVKPSPRLQGGEVMQ